MPLEQGAQHHHAPFLGEQLRWGDAEFVENELSESLEFRTDNLWNAFWCLALLVLTGGALTTGRVFLVGILLGLALATSMKTSLLILTLAAGWAMIYIATGRPKGRPYTGSMQLDSRQLLQSRQRCLMLGQRAPILFVEIQDVVER